MWNEIHLQNDGKNNKGHTPSLADRNLLSLPDKSSPYFILVTDKIHALYTRLSEHLISD